MYLVFHKKMFCYFFNFSTKCNADTYLFTILEETWILDLCFRCLNQRQSFRILLRSESNKPFYLGLLWSVTNCGRDGQKLDSLRFKKHHNYLLLLSESTRHIHTNLSEKVHRFLFSKLESIVNCVSMCTILMLLTSAYMSLTKA